VFATRTLALGAYVRLRGGDQDMGQGQNLPCLHFAIPLLAADGVLLCSPYCHYSITGGVYSPPLYCLLHVPAGSYGRGRPELRSLWALVDGTLPATPPARKGARIRADAAYSLPALRGSHGAYPALLSTCSGCAGAVEDTWADGGQDGGDTRREHRAVFAPPSVFSAGVGQRTLWMGRLRVVMDIYFTLDATRSHRGAIMLLLPGPHRARHSLAAALLPLNTRCRVSMLILRAWRWR